MKIFKIHRAPDYLKVRLKVGDMSAFKLEKVHHLFKDTPKLFILEHPGFNTFEANVGGLPAVNWTHDNLQKAGFNVAKPIGDKVDSFISLYVLYSNRAQNKFLRKFSGKSNVFNDYSYYDLRPEVPKSGILKKLKDNIVGRLEGLKTKSDHHQSNSVTYSFANSVDPSLRDSYYDQELKHLYNDSLRLKAYIRFQKMMSKYEGIQVNFSVPKPSVPKQ